MNEKACEIFLAILEGLQLPPFMPSLIFTILFSEAKKETEAAGACEQSTRFGMSPAWAGVVKSSFFSLFAQCLSMFTLNNQILFLPVEQVRLLRLNKRVANILSAFGLNYMQVSPFRFKMNQN